MACIPGETRVSPLWRRGLLYKSSMTHEAAIALHATAVVSTSPPSSSPPPPPRESGGRLLVAARMAKRESVVTACGHKLSVGDHAGRHCRRLCPLQNLCADAEEMQRKEPFLKVSAGGFEKRRTRKTAFCPFPKVPPLLYLSRLISESCHLQ